MKAYRGIGSIAPLTLNLALGGGERSASCPGHFIPWGMSLLYALNRRLGAPQDQAGSRNKMHTTLS